MNGRPHWQQPRVQPPPCPCPNLPLVGSRQSLRDFCTKPRHGALGASAEFHSSPGQPTILFCFCCCFCFHNVLLHRAKRWHKRRKSGAPMMPKAKREREEKSTDWNVFWGFRFWLWIHVMGFGAFFLKDFLGNIFYFFLNTSFFLKVKLLFTSAHLRYYVYSL